MNFVGEIQIGTQGTGTIQSADDPDGGAEVKDLIVSKVDY
jgi:hypothetical protein